jgi:multiple sugar transport system permease protein
LATIQDSSKKGGPGLSRALRRIRSSQNVEGWLFIAPVVVGVVAFQLFPILVSMYASLTRWSGLNPPEFIGLENFVRMLTDDPLFTQTLFNTFMFTLGYVPLSIVCAFFLALLCNRSIRGVALFRTAFFAPFVTNVVAVGFIWLYFYDPAQGVLNGLLSIVGIQGPEWLSSSRWAMPSVILVSVWQGVGYPLVILLAGLQGIPEELYEAAKIDGARTWRRVRHVTLPLLTPHFFFLTITQFILSFQVFGIIYVMTQGGPGHATSVYIYYLYENAFAYGNLGYASAMAWLLFVLIAVVTIVQWRLQKRWVFYG